MIWTICALLLGCSAGVEGSPERTPAPNRPAATSGKLELKSIDAKAHPTAVCSDGTVPVFYVRRGAKSDKWVVYLKGGSVCRDEAGCKGNPKDTRSSTPWKAIPVLGEAGGGSAEEGKAGGIMSASAKHNPDFYDWNHAYLVSCTSDNWIGDRGASKDTYDMHFRGAPVLAAMVDALKDESIVGKPAMGKAKAVVFSGSSGGAVGLRNHIDGIVKDLPGVDVRGFSDAGIKPALRPGGKGGADAEREGNEASVVLWNAQLPANCLAATPAKDRYLCMVGRHLLVNGHIDTPVFYHMDQRDPKLAGKGPRDDATKEFSRAAAIEIRQLLDNAGTGYIAPARGHHIILNGDAFNEPLVGEHSPAKIFANWYFDRSGPKEVADDDDEPLRDGGGGGGGGKKKKKKRGR